MVAASFTFAGFDFPRAVPILRKRKMGARRGELCTAYRTAPAPLHRGGTGSSFYLASDFAPGLRWTWADEVEGVRIGHNGWYCDGHQDSTIRGVVFRLPRGRGFLAGHSMGEGMATTIEYHTFQEEADAARAADGLAEHAAETERDYQEREEAERQAEEEAEEARALELTSLGL